MALDSSFAGVSSRRTETQMISKHLFPNQNGKKKKEAKAKRNRKAAKRFFLHFARGTPRLRSLPTVVARLAGGHRPRLVAAWGRWGQSSRERRGESASLFGGLSPGKTPASLGYCGFSKRERPESVVVFGVRSDAQDHPKGKQTGYDHQNQLETHST